MSAKKSNGLVRVDRKYLYRQLADIVKGKIESGEYKPGDRLPSMDDLSSEFSINKITVRKALTELAGEGLIYSIPAQGTYVSDRRDEPERVENKLLTVSLISTEVVLSEIGPYHMDLLNGIRQELAKHEASLVLLHSENAKTPAELLNLIKRSDADAMIYLGPQDPTVLRYLIKNGPPSILVDYNANDLNADIVCIDNIQAGNIAMSHLLKLGHTSISVVAGPDDHPVSINRLMGIEKAVEGFGVEDIKINVMHSDFTRAGGEDIVKELLDDSGSSSAILFMNDEMAVGGVQSIYKNSDKKVPEDFSIISIDGTRWSEGTNPPLTVIHIPTFQMGQLSVRQLFNKMGIDALYPAKTTINIELIERGSTLLA
jgi:LacI family transcriptional regulator